MSQERQKSIEHHQEMLATHRDNLRFYLKQKALFSAGYMPHHVEHGIVEARQGIQSTKRTLRELGVPFEDISEDEMIDKESEDLGSEYRQRNRVKHVKYTKIVASMRVLITSATLLLLIIVIYKYTKIKDPIHYITNIDTAITATITPSGDTDKNKTIIPENSLCVQPSNLASNCDFAYGTDGWGNWPNNADGDISVVNGELCVDIRDGGPDLSSYTISPQVFPVNANHSYFISFDAYSGDNRRIAFRAWRFPGSPDKPYFAKEIDLTPNRKHYEFSGDISDTSDPQTQFEFQVGGQGPGHVCIDNIAIQQQ